MLILNGQSNLLKALTKEKLFDNKQSHFGTKESYIILRSDNLLVGLCLLRRIIRHLSLHNSFSPIFPLDIHCFTRVMSKELAFLTPCDQAFNPPFLGGKIIELAKFHFKNKRFEPSLLFFSKPVIVSHCV